MWPAALVPPLPPHPPISEFLVPLYHYMYSPEDHFGTKSPRAYSMEVARQARTATPREAAPERVALLAKPLRLIGLLEPEKEVVPFARLSSRSSSPDSPSPRTKDHVRVVALRTVSLLNP
jgi:hypothetical protein